MFPLRNPDNRANSQDDVAQEEALLIDASKIDPADYISFRAEIPYAINDNDIGHTTIDVIGLDRYDLIERRRDRYTLLKILATVANYDPPTPESLEAKAVLTKAVQDSAPYAAMVRAADAKGFSV